MNNNRTDWKAAREMLRVQGEVSRRIFRESSQRFWRAEYEKQCLRKQLARIRQQPAFEELAELRKQRALEELAELRAQRTEQ